MNKGPLYYILLALFIFSGCKTINISKKEEQPRMIMNRIQKKSINYSVLKIKYTGKYQTNTQNFDFSGSMLIYRDSLIKTSINYLLGLPVAYIKIDPDSIKIKSSFFENIETGIEELNNTFDLPLTYTEIQAIFTNYPFVFPEGNNFNNYLIKPIGNQTIIEYRKRDTISGYSLLLHKITVDSSYSICQHSIWDFRKGRNLEIYIEYKDFKKLNSHRFPFKVNITLINSDTTKLLLNYKSVKIVK
jgi:hypothetical protein